jgi:hypothetical protein
LQSISKECAVIIIRPLGHQWADDDYSTAEAPTFLMDYT